MSMTRKARFVAAFLSGAAFALAGAPATAHGQELVEVSVAYHPNMHGGGLVAVGLENGHFEAEGLAVEPVRFTTGPPEIDAMVAGEIDIGYLGPGAMTFVMLGDVRLLTIDYAYSRDLVLARPESGIETPADLEGADVLLAEGTSGELILRQALKSAGLTYDDITPQAGTMETAVAAFAAGEADAIATWPPFSTELEAQQDLNVVATSDDFAEEFRLPGFWIANNDFVDEHPDLVARFLRAQARANDDRVANLDRHVPLVASFTDAPEEGLRTQVEATQWLTSDEIESAIENGDVARWLTALNEVFVETGSLDEVMPVEEYFDAQLALDSYRGQSDEPATAPEDGGLSVVQVLLIAAGVAVVGAGVLLVRRAVR